MSQVAVWRPRRRSRRINSALFIVLALWGLRHGVSAFQAGSIGTYLYVHWFFVFSYVMLTLTLLLSQRERSYADDARVMDDAYVSVVVPAYNEDPDALEACLHSLLTQTRKPQEIFLIDDGSNKTNYTQLKQKFQREALLAGVHTTWIRKENGGKRHAQAEAFKRSPFTDVYVTVDSDSILDQHALSELLKPLADSTIQSVAGVVIAKNNCTNLLARVTDLLFVTGQLIDRSMMSTLGSVLVNSGGLAAYRGDTVRENLDAYLHEDFFGHHIEFSDDSMLTLFSLERGKTVQQPTAFVFTMMPDKLSHHYRQQLRWMKGSFIRSWWRIKYLPVTSFGFLRQALGWGQFVMTTILFLLLIVSGKTIHLALIPYFLLVPMVVGYSQALRYLTIKRSDESLRSQLFTYSLAPLAMLWSYVVLRPIRIYAMFQCLKNEWGTRGSVEVQLLASNSTIPLRERLHTYRELVVARQTFYEFARKDLLASNLALHEAQQIWHELYSTLDDNRKWELWHSFETFQSRRLSSRFPLIQLAYK
ncbi:MAG TPA: glycosyltransferase [Candidatus Saccharibacteria bacterium]|nr:glycosyltransferase [Candidatus Saccharibacteria bacterium]